MKEKTNNLFYRRQFLLTRKEFDDFKSWEKRCIRDDYILYSHPDLVITDIKIENKRLIVLGDIFDPFNSNYSKYKLINPGIFSNEFKEPDYFKTLLKNKEEISHRKSIRFIKNEIGHFYSTEKQNRKTEKIDSIILNKYTAFPIFLAVMFLMFKISFSISIPLVNFIGILLEQLGGLIRNLSLPDFLISFLTEGIVGGVGTVIAFMPLIFFLFIAVAVLEDSGYLSRTVVLIDRLFQAFGVSGRTFIPMILGFGCNVPAIMATRIIRDKKERMIAIFTNSFIPCSAKLPTYVLFSAIFFPKNTVSVIMFLYLLGIITLFWFGGIMKLAILVESLG